MAARSDTKMSHQKLPQLSAGMGLVLSVLSACSIMPRTSGSDSPDMLVGVTRIQIPCTDPLLIQPGEEVEEGQPSLSADPSCGVLSQQGGTPGTTLTLSGRGFAPNTETDLLWEDQSGNEFRQRQAGEYVKVTTDQNGNFQIDIIMPYRLLPPRVTEDVMIWQLKAKQGKPGDEHAPLNTSLIAEHGLISLTGWLLGITSGVGLGYGLARLLRAVFSTMPRLRRPAVLLPWRTVLMALILPAWFPILIVLYFGLGAKTGTISVGLATFLLTLAYSVSVMLEHWYPASLVSRLIAWARTLATASVVFVYVVGVFGGGGVGFTTTQYIRLLDYKTGLRYYGSIIALILAFDLLLGAVQYIIAMRAKHRSLIASSDYEVQS